MTLGQIIRNLVIGDDYDFERTVTDVPSGDTLTDGWLYIKLLKTDDDQDALAKVHITPTEVADVGVIEDTGADGTAAVLFQLTRDITSRLSSRVNYFYQIKVRTSGDKDHTVEAGMIFPVDTIKLDIT